MAKQPKAKPTQPIVAAKPPPAAASARRTPRGETLIALMRAEGGVTAQTLADAVGWQVHSIRGFIAGTLKKRADLKVTATRVEGATRYQVVDVQDLLSGGEA